MPNYPNRSSQNKSRQKKIPQSSITNTAQHGPSHILAIPAECCTYITSHLDPPSLLALSRVSRYFNGHVQQDNTWLKAFEWHCFQISPEADLGSSSRLLLRRREPTWKREFVNRFNMTRRWNEARNPTVYHSPVHSPVSSFVYLPSANAILTASLAYGVVARSFVHTGKVLKGYLNARGNGPHNGNPNTEFSPDVTSIAMTSSGGTVQIAWGFLSGSVAFTTAPRVMELGRSAKFVRGHFQDSHRGKVEKVVMSGNPERSNPEASVFASASAEGYVKLWESKRVRCIWTSDITPGPTVDACANVALDAEAGVVVGGFASGHVVVWVFESLGRESVETPVKPLYSLRIPPPEAATNPPTQPTIGTPIDIRIASIHAHQIDILVRHEQDPHFYKLSVSLPPNNEPVSYSRIRFTEGPLGPITSFHASFVPVGSVDPITILPTPEAVRSHLSNPGSSLQSPLHISSPATPSLSEAKALEKSFVLTGDTLGRVCIWNLDQDPTEQDGVLTVSSCEKWEAHDDGAVTALQFTNIVIATGSSGGTIKIWDSLSLELLRVISVPAQRSTGFLGDNPRHVFQIVIDDDAIIASVGSQILAWRAGPPKHSKAALKAKAQKAASRNKVAADKWRQQVELSNDIRESRVRLAEEHTSKQAAYGRERAQQTALHELGLSEVEAVEYALMLSRDEEEVRRRSSPETSRDIAIFGMDEDSGVSNDPSSSPSVSASSPPLSRCAPMQPSLASPPNSMAKVQVTPPFRPEPMEAGMGITPLTLSPSSHHSKSDAPSSVWKDPGASFPVMTPSSSGHGSSTGSPKAVGTGSSVGKGWSAIVRSSPPASSSSSDLKNIRNATAKRNPPPLRSQAGPSLLSAGLVRHLDSTKTKTRQIELEDEEEQLRRALELSLIEM